MSKPSPWVAGVMMVALSILSMFTVGFLLCLLVLGAAAAAGIAAFFAKDWRSYAGPLLASAVGGFVLAYLLILVVVLPTTIT